MLPLEINIPYENNNNSHRRNHLSTGNIETPVRFSKTPVGKFPEEEKYFL